MSITWTRDTQGNTSTISRLGSRGEMSKGVPYIVTGAETEDIVHAAAAQYIQTSAPFWTFPGQPLVRLPAQSYDVESLGGTAWRVTIRYERQGADDDRQTQPLKRARSFDTTGRTQHVTVMAGRLASENAVRVWTKDGEVENPTTNDHFIGWDGEQVHGVDILEPALQWTETYDVPANYVTVAYVKKVAAMTGTVNKFAFRGFAAGEVLFTGSTGSQQSDTENGDGPFSLTYKFDARPNAGDDQTLPSFLVGPIAGVEKRGHDYLSVLFDKEVDVGRLVPSAAKATVFKVYRETDFSLLGIGTT